MPPENVLVSGACSLVYINISCNGANSSKSSVLVAAGGKVDSPCQMRICKRGTAPLPSPHLPAALSLPAGCYAPYGEWVISKSRHDCRANNILPLNSGMAYLMTVIPTECVMLGLFHFQSVCQNILSNPSTVLDWK